MRFMEKRYGNRIPSVHRWAVAALVLVPVFLLGVAAVAGTVTPLPALLLAVVGTLFVFAYWTGGTTVSADADSVRLALFPLWRKSIPSGEIRSIRVEPIKPLEREWGNRGSLRRDGEIFVDAGQSQTCLAFHLVDGSTIRLGVSSPEHGQDIAEALDLPRA
jgi:hypothetical protein